MTDHLQPQAELEIAHVLFIDVVGYTTLLINEQTAVVGQLTRLVRETPHFKAADAAAKLIRIPTGDGMALVFFNSPEAPAHCAIELAQALRGTEKIHVRMGIHSGPVHSVADVNGQTNVAGQGINTAQRVMECADGGHILLSKRVAEDLSHHGKWRPSLHPLGEVEAKHGEIVSVVNLYGENYGNPAVPRRVREAKQPASRPRQRRLIWIVIAALGLIIAAVASLELYHSSSSVPWTVSSATPVKSIAVLPFDNFSEDKQNAYFADGIQDDILTALAKVADLKVISRSSVMRYRDTNRDLRQIAHELNVSHLLQGSVRRAGDEIRVTAQLIDARTNNQVWAENYDRKLSDIFEIQSDVAHEIANRLKATISPEEKAAIALRPTNDLEAFDLFLQAKQMVIAFDDSPDRKQTLLRAIRLLDEAIERDGKFALAYSWAAIAHDNLYWFDLDHTPARLQLAESCVRSALQLNPELGEAHLAQGLIAYHGYRDYTKARQYLDTARRLLPNSAEVFSLIGYIDRRQGHWDDSVRNLQHAAELDPRNFKVLTGLSVLYDLMRRYDDKERLYDRAIEINPTSSDYFQLLRAETELEKGNANKAASLLDQLPSGYDPDGAATAARIALSLSQNNTTAARAALEGCKLEELVGATGALLPRSYFDGQIARAENDATKMRTAFSTAREKVESKLQTEPDNGLWHGVLCVVKAGLGLKNEAITEGQKAVSLLPVNKDAVDGPVAEAYLAMGYAWLGEKDSAIELLTDLATCPGGPTYGELLLDPGWRDVRSDARFQQMLVKLKPGGR
jgi:TolB-like protein/class 3 adenylate cyclase/Tfp pilus assembly protein PilF